MSDLRIEEFFMKLEESDEKVNKWQDGFSMAYSYQRMTLEELERPHIITIDDETIFTGSFHGPARYGSPRSIVHKEIPQQRSRNNSVGSGNDSKMAEKLITVPM